MKNKIAIVSGASGNLGQAVIRKFLSDGYTVVGTVVPGDPVVIAINDPSLKLFTVDLMDEEASGNFIDEVVLIFGSIDTAVMTVGGFTSGDIAKTRSADILKQYQLNFSTAYHLARPVFLKMKQQGEGRIFFVGSRPGLDMMHSKGMTAYGIAKSLVFRLAELINEESRQQNIVASVIVPGTIDTPQNRKAMPDADFSSWVPADAIAEAIAFYSSEKAGSIREPVIKLYNRS